MIYTGCTTILFISSSGVRLYFLNCLVQNSLNASGKNKKNMNTEKASWSTYQITLKYQYQKWYHKYYEKKS